MLFRLSVSTITWTHCQLRRTQNEEAGEKPPLFDWLLQEFYSGFCRNRTPDLRDPQKHNTKVIHTQYICLQRYFPSGNGRPNLRLAAVLMQYSDGRKVIIAAAGSNLVQRRKDFLYSRKRSQGSSVGNRTFLSLSL